MVITPNIFKRDKVVLSVGLKKKLKKLASFTEDYTKLEKQVNWSVNLIFIGEKESLEFNQKYRKKDYPADVLAFPFFNLYKDVIDNCSELGDIFVCHSLVEKKAKEYNSTLLEELCLVFVHGLLHLLGYNHYKQSEQKVMFNLQSTILGSCSVRYYANCLS